MPCLSKAGSLDRQPTSTWPWSMSGAGSVEPSLPSASPKPSRESLVRFRNRVGPNGLPRSGESRPRFWARPPASSAFQSLPSADLTVGAPAFASRVAERLFHSVYSRGLLVLDESQGRSLRAMWRETIRAVGPASTPPRPRKEMDDGAGNGCGPGARAAVGPHGRCPPHPLPCLILSEGRRHEEALQSSQQTSESAPR